MNDTFPFGEKLGSLRTEIPGPQSRELAERLRKTEARNVTFLSGDFPVFWERALGSNVEDVDGNIFVDLSAAFGVASLGHGDPAVMAAVAAQLHKLPHGMGDIHPPAVKVELLEKLSAIFPGGNGRAILCSAGAEAVEAALKTAYLRTSRPGVIAFEGAYHGLTYGTLAVGGHPRFSGPFARQVAKFSRLAAYPAAETNGNRAAIDRSVAEIEKLIEEAKPTDCPVGAILVEPMLGRGGMIVPPPGWLKALRELATRNHLLLIVDEIMTGFGRTGAMFAVDHENVVPDLLCVGKALTGALPFSACIGTEETMNAWPVSTGDALHTSTFLGHPLGCAAALAAIHETERRDLSARAGRFGSEILGKIRAWPEMPIIKEVRGRGLAIGIELEKEGQRGLAFTVARKILAKGVILLPGGTGGNVISLTPPLTIGGRQIDWALSALQETLADMP